MPLYLHRRPELTHLHGQYYPLQRRGERRATINKEMGGVYDVDVLYRVYVQLTNTKIQKQMCTLLFFTGLGSNVSCTRGDLHGRNKWVYSWMCQILGQFYRHVLELRSIPQ